MAEVGSPAPYRLRYLPTGLVLVSVTRLVGTSRVDRRRGATDHFAVYRTERNQPALTIAFESAGHEPDAEPDTQINGLRVWCADGSRRRSVIAAGDDFILTLTASEFGPGADALRGIVGGLELPR
ncbi:hypothetical protein ACIA58_18270 [Kribbella sp. NPDC051586]|uniref:hypothetical protein n=1 Tax=Kribbella sp. NPDC051586 TaxID=3364118 RepID=UPI0037A2E763